MLNAFRAKFKKGKRNRKTYRIPKMSHASQKRHRFV